MSTVLSHNKLPQLGFVDCEPEEFRLRCNCGEEFTVRRFPALSTVRTSPELAICAACERVSNEAEAKRAAAAAKLAAIEAQIPDRYRWATLTAPELTQRVRPLTAIAEATETMGAPSLVFLGPAGTGKTSLACAILRAASEQRGVYAGSYVTAFALAKARQEHKLGDGEAPKVEEACKARLLLIDELGAELGRNTAVQEVIHERHERQLPTLYTSGFTLGELEQRYGAGIVRRILESAKVIQLGRPAAARVPQGQAGVGYSDHATRRAGE